ncbi:TPA: PapG carbohydrate binding domain-containing protein [Escherichia coli]|nr:fimbrial protein [Escherichia coli]HAW7497948.1 fimbrial protein [Escherichia coli]
MKKWFPAFLFLSLSGGNDALAANQSTMFYSFSNTLSSYQGKISPTDFMQFVLNVPHGISTATLSYVACNGFTWTYGVYWSEYLAWLVIPKYVVHGGQRIYLDLQYTGSWGRDAEDDDNYYLTYGFGWDQSTAGGGRVCFNSGEQRDLSWTFDNVTVNARLPVDLPKGHYSFPVKFLRGIQRNNYDYLGGRYKIPSSLMKTFPFNSTFNLSFDSTGGCRPSAQSLEINHGNLSINSANNHYAAQTLSVSCDVPTNIRFFLLSNTAPAYSHGQKFSVGLGHGWDSIVSVNGVDTGETRMRWYRAGTQNLTIGSRLYGESSKIQPGVLSGSATLLMILP